MSSLQQCKAWWKLGQPSRHLINQLVKFQSINFQLTVIKRWQINLTLYRMCCQYDWTTMKLNQIILRNFRTMNKLAFCLIPVLQKDIVSLCSLLHFVHKRFLKFRWKYKCTCTIFFIIMSCTCPNNLCILKPSFHMVVNLSRTCLKFVANVLQVSSR